MTADRTGANGQAAAQAAAVAAPSGAAGIDSLIENAARTRTNLERRQADTSRRLERVERLQQELRELVGSNGRAPA